MRRGRACPATSSPATLPGRAAGPRAFRQGSGFAGADQGWGHCGFLKSLSIRQNAFARIDVSASLRPPRWRFSRRGELRTARGAKLALTAAPASERGVPGRARETRSGSHPEEAVGANQPAWQAVGAPARELTQVAYIWEPGPQMGRVGFLGQFFVKL